MTTNTELTMTQIVTHLDRPRNCTDYFAADPDAWLVDLVGVALDFARGDYQRSFLRGLEAYSGSTLCGLAKSYSGRYQAGLDNMLARIAATGLTVLHRTGSNGRHQIVIGAFPTGRDLANAR